MTFRSNFVASIKSDGKILREIDNQVILPFQTEYSILLKNLDTRRASVKVSIDGQDVLYGKSLILNPDSSIELERFVDDLDKGGKFKFIKKTQEISDYRGDKIDDGLVRVTYQFEKYKQELPCQQPFIYPLTFRYGNFFPSTTKSSESFPLTGEQSIGRTEGVSIMNNQLSVSSVPTNAAVSAYHSLLTNKVEDGITVQGSKSEQQFSYGSIGELEDNSHVIVIELKGSNKITTPITVKTKIQCPTCGRASKDKFCGNCGTGLIIY